METDVANLPIEKKPVAARCGSSSNCSRSLTPMAGMSALSKNASHSAVVRDGITSAMISSVGRPGLTIWAT